MGCSIISSVQLGHTWTFTPSCSNLAEVKDSERKFVKTTTTKKRRCQWGTTHKSPTKTYPLERGVGKRRGWTCRKELNNNFINNYRVLFAITVPYIEELYLIFKFSFICSLYFMFLESLAIRIKYFRVQQ